MSAGLHSLSLLVKEANQLRLSNIGRQGISVANTGLSLTPAPEVRLDMDQMLARIIHIL